MNRKQRRSSEWALDFQRWNRIAQGQSKRPECGGQLIDGVLLRYTGPRPVYHAFHARCGKVSADHRTRVSKKIDGDVNFTQPLTKGCRQWTFHEDWRQIRAVDAIDRIDNSRGEFRLREDAE